MDTRFEPLARRFRPRSNRRRDEPRARRLERLSGAVAAAAEKETPRMALWTPIGVGVGVALWFSWPGPHPLVGAWVAAALVLIGLAAHLAARRAAPSRLEPARLLGPALAALAAGYLAADIRAARVAAPVVSGSDAVVSLTARAVAYERTARGRPRLLLDRISIDGLAADRTPRRLRVTTAGLSPEAARDLVGRRLGMNARLFAPPPSIEPGGLDLRRRSFFEQIGGYGRAEGPPKDLGPAKIRGPADAFAAAVSRARADLSEAARAAAPGATGAVLAALLVGDRADMPADALQNLRDSNLAHLLAISGLHMALVSVSVFAALRLALALLSRAPFGLEQKKLAALGALGAAAAYLLLSGAAIATQRAFIMAAVAFLAILVDRPPVTLRAVAAAAVLILLYAPESLMSPGFQLSFAATAAMVAVFEAVRPWLRAVQIRRGARLESSRGLRRLWLRLNLPSIFTGLLLASLVAGLATAPFAALHFQRVSLYGLIANLAATPAMGAFIMPAGVGAMIAAPLGLEGPFLWIMARGVDHVLWVASSVASWPGATAQVPAAGGVIGWIALGGAAAVVCAGAAPRLAAAGVLGVGLALWAADRRPDVLATPGARLIGVMTDQGRAFDRPRAAFAAETWLRRDGDPASLDDAYARAAFARFSGGAAARAATGWRVELVLADRLTPRRILQGCRERTLLIAPRAPAPEAAAPKDCSILSREALRGAVAVWLPESGAPVFRFAEGPPRPWSAEQLTGESRRARTPIAAPAPTR